MGKGFNNYMTKKFFHPSSKENIKRVWMAQQKTTFEQKKQEDLMNQYQKEQDMLQNRALLGDEKAKLGLSFLYDAPPGLKNKEKEEDEPEYKFEWQRKFNAPREAYAKDDETIRDQPFGIEVRNVRCIKCRQWGHVNTDKICPLYCTNLTAEPPKPENSTLSLVEGLREEGFRFKDSVLGRLMETGGGGGGRAISESEDEDDPEVQFLKSLTPSQKKKLIKKLDKLQGGKKKSKKHKKKGKKSRRNDSDSESSDPERKPSKSRMEHHSDYVRDRGHEEHGKQNHHSSRDDMRPRDYDQSRDRRDDTRMREETKIREGRRDDRRDRQMAEMDHRRERKDQYISVRERTDARERKRHRHDSSPKTERSVDMKKIKKEPVTGSDSDSSPVREKSKKNKERSHSTKEHHKIKKGDDSSSDSDGSPVKEKSKNRKERSHEKEERKKIKKEYSASSDSDSSPVREKSRIKKERTHMKEERHKVKKEYGPGSDSSPVGQKSQKGKSRKRYDSESDVSPVRERKDDRKRNGSHNESRGRKDRRSGERKIKH